MLDIAIIGNGPAGLSAGINAKIRNKNVEVFGNNISTSYLYKAERVDNYLGFNKITGEKLLDKFIKHAKKMKLKIHEGKVIEIYNMGEYFTINFNNKFVDTKAIIIATGLTKSKLYNGEETYLGKGVSYCATCDGNLYKGKKILVVGESTDSDEEVHFLSELAKKVYYLTNKEQNIESDNVEYIKARVEEICGNDIVKSVILSTGEIEVDGIFILRESTPVSKLIAGLEIENNMIKVTRQMEANIPGVFAAGDCTGKPFQISKAVGEGLVAALSAASYLDKVDEG
ncbi:MAG: thioredoxin reductase [Clostridiales bacterium GWE2_32_10]|nr:MAG: thioredoxin reductase [Clostridiales bacterium GWE2_32_10]HBY21336.1 thioredoxin reductase [Clostridiales bacterium]